MARKKKSLISCEELKDIIEAGEEITLIDLREPEEFEICRIQGSILIPYKELEEHIPDFDESGSYVVHCKEGDVSQDAVGVLKKKGFEDVKFLDGGIHKWALEIDKKMEIY